jgi:hypothetical protein
MKILKVKVSELKYDVKNARLHDSKNIKAITDSLKQFGQQKPIVIGSDNTVIACEKTGRKCYGMEIDPHYCQVILERWAKYSNKQWAKIEDYDF